MKFQSDIDWSYFNAYSHCCIGNGWFKFDFFFFRIWIDRLGRPRRSGGSPEVGGWLRRLFEPVESLTHSQQVSWVDKSIQNVVFQTLARYEILFLHFY